MTSRKVKTVRVFQSALVLIFAWPFSAAVAGDDTTVRVEFERKPPKGYQPSADDPLENVRVFLEIDTVQPDETRGLAFTIEIVNENDEPVKLSDPTERIGIYLLDDKGRMCALPNLTMSASGAHVANRKAHRQWLDAKRAYIIDTPEAGTYPNTTKTVRELDTDKHWSVVLQPGEVFWLPVRIAEVRTDRRTPREEIQKQRQERKEHGVIWTRPPPERAPITAGLYRLTVMNSLTCWKGLDYTTKRLKRVTAAIRLGEPAAE